MCRAATFQSQHGSLLEFVCPALKSSLGSHETHGDGAARSPSGRPNEDAAPQFSNSWGNTIQTYLYTNAYMNIYTHIVLLSA